MTDLEPIRKRLAAATPGQWWIESHAHGAYGCRCLSCDDRSELFTVRNHNVEWCDENVGRRTSAGELNDFGKELSCCENGPFLNLGDAELAVSAPADITALLAEIDRLRENSIHTNEWFRGLVDIIGLEWNEPNEEFPAPWVREEDVLNRIKEVFGHRASGNTSVAT